MVYVIVYDPHSFYLGLWSQGGFNHESLLNDLNFMLKVVDVGDYESISMARICYMDEINITYVEWLE